MKALILKIALIAIFAMSACTDSALKANYIASYATWINTLDGSFVGYKDADWAKAEINFIYYSDTEFEKYKDVLTTEEKVQIDKLTGRYYGILAKHKLIEAKVGLKSILNKAQGAYEELAK
jgi:hypothetical protein